jgi:cell division control protein 11
MHTMKPVDDVLTPWRSDSSILPEDMANQSVRLKEEQLRREEEKLRDIELKVQREIQLKRQELLAKEDSLKVLEARLGE